jgi:hypothetical protein
LELAKHESELPASGEEKQFIAALQDRKVKDAPLEQLKEVLRLIMVKVGLRAANWPNDEEKAVLLSHILTNYGGHTPKEILLAFDMAILGQLDADVNHYENFSCKYFSEIMNAYRAWAKEAHRQNVKEMPALEMKEDLSEKTMSDWYEETAKQIKANKLPLDLVPQMLADWMIKKGTIEDYTMYYPPAVERIKNQLIANATDRQVRKDYNEFREMYNSGEFSGVWKEKIERLAKAMSVNDYVLKNPS